MLFWLVEEGVIMIIGFILWIMVGVFYFVILGVDVFDYVFYVFFNYLNGVIVVFMVVLGMGMLIIKV